ncbi:[protein-PII] uridylyltransferase [Dissulfurirhabdus thermomarina]|uniref:Bifunctional uridylyltransferase/uridylyl-removing enzyme n=1 Tax=Dissulfurirhabdus thermomarina TaxID=1765737 RepID=A0A6N9TQU8_DISTH|nr:[protein-PII] uridylyltransferase [Dissulfurirhabdus thermomarina]NDY42483.1 [protein-PII] uridylyltransferase [Dissulfurirhabdus thermomarina]NMX22880.1 [protein-PII] uridylyltransferase [Dissulfurirhabdus thermomarina]
MTTGQTAAGARHAGAPPAGPGAELAVRGEALADLWARGLSGRALLHAHADRMDAWLAERFREAWGEAPGMALVALGGYGRRELFPYADVDLLVLYDEAASGRVAGVAERILYPLWDLGLEVGHGVRTVADCLEQAGRDFFFQVALLEARRLAGDRGLFDGLRSAFAAAVLEDRRAEFARAMAAHRAERLRRFGGHAYLLEPHLKESPGGLRDVNAVFWTGKAVFGLADPGAFEEAGLFTAEQRARFEAAWDALVRLRNRLHLAAGRRNDRLYFERQQELAAALGYRGGDGMLGVERFMREVYGHLETVRVTADLFFEHVEEVLEPGAAGGAGRRLEPGLEVRGGRVRFADPEAPRRRPWLLMRAFAWSARTGAPLHHSARTLVRDHLDLVDDRLRRSRRMAAAFLAALTEAADPRRVLDPMLETGLLAAYIPEFAQVVALAQHDVYHVFTVDRHLLQTVAEVRRLRDEEPHLFADLASPHVLFLAALFHDIGKGGGGGHAERGAKAAETIGRRMGLAPKERACLAFLVRHHLFLTDTALRRDLDDEDLILRCARTIRDPDRLRMLYLLSIADGRATGPAAWTQWRAVLVQELFLKVAHLLERTDLASPDRIQAVEWMRRQVAERLRGSDAPAPGVFPEDYLLAFGPDEVAGHVRLAARVAEGRGPVVVPADQGTCWSVLVMARDRAGLLARICGVFALHNLRVLGARIFTWSDGTAVDVLEVAPALEGEALGDHDWERLRADMAAALSGRLGLTYRIRGKRPPVGERGCLRPEVRVEVDDTVSDFHTVVEVYAPARAGLLYDITRTLAEFGVDISRARVSTHVDQVVNVFYVRDRHGAKIDDPDLREEIRRALADAAAC